MKDTTEIENRLIGHIINFDKGKSLISELSDDLFTDETNRSLFAIIRKEFKSGNPDTGILLSKCSNEQKQRILECADSSFRTDNVNEYIKILIDESAKRFMKSSLESSIIDGSISPSKLRSIADTADEIAHNDTFRQNEKMLNDYISHIGKAHKGIKTYFPKLDRFTSGLKKGTLAILAARPSVGKTTLALNIAANCALHGQKVMFFSLEMTYDMILDRVFSSQCNIPYENFRNSQNAEQLQSTARNFALGTNISKYLIVRDRTRNVEAITSEIAKEKPQLVIVDYVQIVSTLKKFGESKRLQIDYITGELKAIAKQTGCCVILLSQLRRADTNHIPTMEDLKESGGLEQDGDYVFLLDREYVRNRDSGIPPEETMLIIAKNKFGKTAKIELNFDGKYQNFTEPKKTNFPPYKTPKAPIMLDISESLISSEIQNSFETHELDN